MKNININNINKDFYSALSPVTAGTQHAYKKNAIKFHNSKSRHSHTQIIEGGWGFQLMTLMGRGGGGILVETTCQDNSVIIIINNNSTVLSSHGNWNTCEAIPYKMHHEPHEVQLCGPSLSTGPTSHMALLCLGWSQSGLTNHTWLLGFEPMTFPIFSIYIPTH